MGTTLDQIRNKYEITEERERELDAEEQTALKRIQKGVCPSCGSKMFKGMVCRQCKFDGSALAVPVDTEPEEIERNMQDIARRAVEFRTKSAPQPEDETTPVDPDTEMATRRDEIARRHLRSQVEHKRTADGAQYAIAKDPVTGKLDAVIQFGKWKGHAVSEMILQPESCGYVRWMLSESFPDDLKSIIRVWLGLPSEAT